MASATDFISNLGGVLSTQFSLGDNTNNTLNTTVNGQVVRDGKLGDFAKNVDQSASRSYAESGILRNDYYNYTPTQREILWQEPSATVLVKKRMFSSLSENFDPSSFDKFEKLFYKATIILFQNKCKQIATFEKLSKVSQISTQIGSVDYHLLPILFNLTDNITTLPGSLGLTGAQDSINGSLSQFKSIVDRVREIVALSQDAQYTSWIPAISNSFQTSFGTGTGVIEFTNVSSISTTTGLKFGEGTFSLNFSDPYKLMKITNLDIEQAISDAINKFYNNNFISLGQDTLNQTIAMQKNLLNSQRATRGAQEIDFIVDADTYLGKRIRAIINPMGFEINFDANTIGNIVGTDKIDPSALQGSAALGNNGLSPSDISLFNNIVSSLYTNLSLSTNTRRAAIADNQDPTKNLNKLRQKMRLHYGGKRVIQPM